jgi:ABC-type multidrug transport system permease subunit
VNAPRRSYVRAALGVAGRTLRTTFRNPALLVPPLVAPLIFFAVFGGGLGEIGKAPGFDFPGGYTSFAFVFILLNAASFAALFAGFGLAEDLERGFSRRLFLATGRRSAVIVGYALSAFARVAMSMALLFAVGTAVGVRVEGSAGNAVLLVAIALAYGTVVSLWGMGVALRVRSIQGAPAMQVPALLALFLAPAFAPVPLLTGWIHAAARGNPITYFLESGRGFVAGSPFDVALTFGTLAALVLIFAAWTGTGLRRAIRAV